MQIKYEKGAIINFTIDKFNNKKVDGQCSNLR